MKVTELHPSKGKKRLTIADICFNGGEVVIINGEGYLYIVEEDVGLNLSVFNRSECTAFAKLETGELTVFPDETPCSLVSDAELRYERTMLKDWAD